MLNRKYNLKLDLQFRCNNSNMEFNQFDKNTSDFFIRINRNGKEMDLSKALVTLMVIKPNGNVDSQFLEVAEGGVYANLKPSLRDIPGDYQCKAIVTIKDETVIPEQIFTYTVNEDKFLAAFNQNMAANEDYSLLTDILGRLSTIEADEQQRQINEAERILNEEARKDAENTRVEAELIREHNDADREKAEAIRESNEFIRKTSENSRVEVESNRVEAEKLRVNAETSRVEAEKARNDNYHFMTSDEERRRNEENSRIEAEKLRKQAEATRINAESQRRTTEQSRALKENERNSNEISREVNEVSRKANEEKRVQAETNRSNRYDNFIADAESAANNFKAYISTAKQEEEARKANELARVKSEDVRVSNEVKRISDENTRKANEDRRVGAETIRQSKFDAKVVEVNNKINEVNTSKNAMVADTKKAIDKMNNDFNSLSASQQQDAEVILARDGEESLNARLVRDLFIGDKSLKQEVIDLGGLKESQDMAYATDKGYLVCKETRSGTVKDLRISGKSLVNLCPNFEINYTASSDFDGFQFVAQSCDAGAPRKILQDIEPNTQYTIMCNVINMGDSGNYRINNPDVSSVFPEVLDCKKGINIFHVTSKAELTSAQSKVLRCQNRNCRGNVHIKDIMILKGHIQSPPSYFEGIASVGNEVDKIEVLSMNNGNILNSELVKAGVNGDTGKLSVSSSGSGTVTQQEIIPVVPNIKLYYKSTGERTFRGGGNTFLYKYGVNNEYLGRDTCVTFNPIYIPSNCYGVRVAFTDFELSKDYPADKYGVVFSQFENFVDTPVKQDKKPILFKDADGVWKPIKELRGLAEICDTIELHSDGKYYYHIRTGKLIINGTEDIKDFPVLRDNTISFQLKCPDCANTSDIAILCDKIASSKTYDVNNLDVEGICLWDRDNYIRWRILKSKLETPNLEGMKKYAQANNLTVIYQLAEEKVFEVNPLFLEAYKGETMIRVDSGVINAPMEFKLTSSLPNLTRNLQLRIDNLEDEIYKSQELQDIMLLENDLRLMDLEFALLESMPIKLNLRSDVMFAKGVTEFEFLKKRIESGSHTDEYLEKCINKYKKAGRLTDEEYDILYDMIYPPVYDVLADK